MGLPKIYTKATTYVTKAIKLSCDHKGEIFMLSGVGLLIVGIEMLLNKKNNL